LSKEFNSCVLTSYILYQHYTVKRQGFAFSVIEWNCQKGWRFHEGLCYFVNTATTSNANDAKSVCEANDATLAVFKERPQLVNMSFSRLCLSWLLFNHM